MIVIATHGLTGIDRMLMGSITEKVVRQSPCPVFTVKAFGKDLLAADN
jgi:nucleotide-binding universal stress UspA family protein